MHKLKKFQKLFKSMSMQKIERKSEKVTGSSFFSIIPAKDCASEPWCC